VSEDALKVLMSDYAQHTEEIRDLLKSMDTNLQVAMVILAADIGAAKITKEPKLFLAFIPTIIFVFCLIHFLKTASANIHGAYRDSLVPRIRDIAQDQGLMPWHEGPNTSSPTGVVQGGFYLIFLVLLGAFVVCTYLAYPLWHWIVLVHVAYAVVLVLYICWVFFWSAEIKKLQSGATSVGAQDATTRDGE
jgi:hypothetical protein